MVKLNSSEIRLKILMCLGQGLSRAETVQNLKESCQINEKTSYYHFKTMPKWIGAFIDLKNAEVLQQQIANIYWQTIRDASYKYRHASTDNAQIGWKHVILEATERLSAFLPAGMVSTPNVVITLENNLAAKTVLPQNEVPKISLEVTQ